VEKDILDKEYYEKRISEELEDIAISVDNGKVEFTHVDHSRRAQRFGRISDGNTTEYGNIALEYFGNRCALSGEKFERFELDNSTRTTNLSAEHVVALAIGGHDIAPNIVPSVLQYNVRKNGYYILDYWSKQKDNNGKPIYSPYRLLKVVNYMLKSIEARKTNVADIESYRQAILTPNAIDNLLAKIEEQDLQETDNSKRQILSSTITTTTLDEDNKKILTTVPSIDKDIPDQHEQAERENDYREMIESFISDSIGVIGKELPYQKLTRENGAQVVLSQELQSMFERVVDTIPIEVQIRKTIIDILEQQGIENVYTITNSYIYNTDILERVRELSDEQRQEYVAGQIKTRVQELLPLLTKEEVVMFVSDNPHAIYDDGIIDKIKLWKQLDIQMPNVEWRNIEYALKIVREYDFERSLGRYLTQDEEKALVQCLISNKYLMQGKARTILALQSKLASIGLTEQETYGAIINFAIGTGNEAYSDVLNGSVKYNAEIKSDIVTEINSEALKEALFKNGINTLENTIKLQELGIEASEVDPRNIDFALKIVREYDFERTLGRHLTQDEEKALVQSLVLGQVKLNKTGRHRIATLQIRLQEAGLTEQEAYGTIINYAIGKGNGYYSNALGGKIKYDREKKDDIVSLITTETIKEALLKNGMNTPENTQKLKALGIEASKVDPRNIDFALKIVREYDFERTLGKHLTQDEEKALIQLLILRQAKLNKGGECYLINLQSKLACIGLTEQEAYGAIMNYAIGTGNGAYSDALGGKIKYDIERKNEIVSLITTETLKEALLETGMEVPENTQKLKALGIKASEVDPRNIDFALKIVREYDFERLLGRSLTQDEEKVLVHSLISNKKLYKGEGRSTVYILTLQRKLVSEGLTEQEAYATIINCAVGKDNYSMALSRKKHLPKGLSKITTQTLKEILLKNGINTPENTLKLQELGIEASEVDPRNIDFALKIVREYNFEGVSRRKLTLEEEKILIQRLVAPAILKKAKKPKYISTLQRNLVNAGLTEQEAYGAIINYAIGKGSYSIALDRCDIKHVLDNTSEMTRVITIESISKEVMKRQNKPMRAVKRSVLRETITQIDDTLAAIDSMVAERDGQQKETV